MDKGSNCGYISMKLHKVKELYGDFKKLREAGEFKKALGMRGEIDREIAEAKEYFRPTEMFFRELEKEEVWEKIKKVLDANYIPLEFSSERNSTARYFDKLARVFEDVPVIRHLDNEEYHHFMNRMASFMNQVASDSDFWAKVGRDGLKVFSEDFPRLLNSVFINKFANEETEIEINEQLPEQLRDDFCCFLERGTVKVKETGWRVGLHMRGGVLMVGEASLDAVRLMEGGTFIAGSAETGLAAEMKGGTVAVMEAKGIVAERGRGGTIFIDYLGIGSGVGHGTKGKISIIVNDNYNRDRIVDWRRVFFHSDFARGFVSIDQVNKVSLRISPINLSYSAENLETKIKTEKDLKKLSNKGGLGVARDLSRMPKNVTEQMTAGILVLKELPEEKIGAGMEGGIVVIDIDGLSLEDARAKVEQRRQGGLILMRTDDSDNQGEKKLVIL